LTSSSHLTNASFRSACPLNRISRRKAFHGTDFGNFHASRAVQYSHTINPLSCCPVPCRLFRGGLDSSTQVHRLDLLAWHAISIEAGESSGVTSLGILWEMSLHAELIKIGYSAVSSTMIVGGTRIEYLYQPQSAGGKHFIGVLQSQIEIRR
jgi:hypothetical protein